MSRFTPHAARECLYACGVNRTQDFHTLPSSTVERLVEQARFFKYRKPKNANGSTARYFHAYLVRTATRKEIEP